MAEHPEPDEDVRTEIIPPAGNESMREVDLDTAVRRQTTIGMRVIQVGVLLTLVLVFGGLVFHGYWAGQPQPTSVAVDDFSMNAAIYSNVNHGTLIVNGKKLDVHPPVIVTLRPGTNIIAISAPPFRPHTCTVDMHRQRVVEGAQCFGTSLGDIGLPMDTGMKQAAMRVEMPLTLTDLSSEQQQSVEAVVSQEIDGIVVHTSVPAHQYIATGVDAKGHITSRLADEELQADATLVRRASQASQPNDTCVENICAAEYSPCGNSDWSNTADTVLKVATVVVPQWRFTSRTGDMAALSPLNVADQTLFKVPLQYDAAHGWRPWGAPEWGNDCDARDIMANIHCGAGSSALSAYGPVNIASVSPNGIEGCDIQVLNSSGKFARFIWRFGVLLAADSEAKKMIPSIPLAPQAEIDAVTKQA